MANTRNDITVYTNTWVNLYTQSGIAPGTAVHVYNKGSSPCNCVISVDQPVSGNMGVPLYTGSTGSYLYVSAGEAGLWAYAGGITKLLVQEA